MRQWLAGVLMTMSATMAMAEDGITADRILIGQTGGLIGTVAGPVKEINEGARAYFEMVNRQGGIYGRKIEMRFLEDRFDPALAKANVEKLITQDKVFALFQGRGTPHTKGILPLLEQYKVPLVAPSTGATLLHVPAHPYVFNVRARYRQEVAKAVEHFSTVGMRSIGILIVDDAFGQDGLAGFQQAMTERSLTPAIVTTFARVNPDVNATAATIIAADPQALIIVSSAKNTVAVIQALRAQQGRMQIMTLSNNSSESFVEELGPAGAGVIVSQITPAPHLVSTPLGQEFKAAARATGATVSYAAMEGFVNAKVLVEGLRRSGPNPTRAGLIKALESMQRVDLGGLMVTYSPDDHTGSEFVELTMIGKNGRFIR